MSDSTILSTLSLSDSPRAFRASDKSTSDDALIRCRCPPGAFVNDMSGCCDFHQEQSQSGIQSHQHERALSHQNREKEGSSLHCPILVGFGDSSTDTDPSSFSNSGEKEPAVCPASSDEIYISGSSDESNGESESRSTEKARRLLTADQTPPKLQSEVSSFFNVKKINQRTNSLNSESKKSNKRRKTLPDRKAIEHRPSLESRRTRVVSSPSKLSTYQKLRQGRAPHHRSISITVVPVAKLMMPSLRYIPSFRIPGNRFSTEERPLFSDTELLSSFLPKDMSIHEAAKVSGTLSNISGCPKDTDGFIYVFCETPAYNEEPSERGIQDLLLGPKRNYDMIRRRKPSEASEDIEETMKTALNKIIKFIPPAISGESLISNESSSPEDNILVKIGRTANVNERKKTIETSCKRKITMLLLYCSGASSNGKPDTIPYIELVEKLIHQSLDAYRVKKSCEGCNMQHREWFEIPGTIDGIEMINSCIRRWILWAQAKAGNYFDAS